jgi:lipoate-protein ligase A
MTTLIRSENLNPFFNLAMEEYLLKNSSEDIILIYRNNPCVVVGKHQNTLAEIDLRVVRQSDIEIVRRISGGGTVYHDPGNLNFSFIKNHGGEGHQVDFQSAVKPIIGFLHSFGLNAHILGKNSLGIDQKKVSGNSAHVHRRRTIHHGTLLYQANLETLDFVVQKNPESYTSKAVQSVRASVANISDLMPEPISLDSFSQQLIEFLHPQKERELTSEEVESITLLATSKYNTWEWNFGYSPDYHFTRNFSIADKNFSVGLVVSKGVINEVHTSGLADASVSSLLRKYLLHTRHHEIINMSSNAFEENMIFAPEITSLIQHLI